MKSYRLLEKNLNESVSTNISDELFIEVEETQHSC